jgi:HTH-type transcriptional regulator/antitoxin HigA
MPRLPVRVLRRAFGASTSNMLQDNRLNRFAAQLQSNYYPRVQKMTAKYPYSPDYAVAPGATLKETLAVKGLSQADLALRTGLAEKTVSQIINGIASITYETAEKLELALGIPARFWNARERSYRELLVRMEEIRRLDTDVHWLREIPLRELIDRDYVKEEKDKRAIVRQALRFFGVSSVEAWRNTWLAPAAQYRGSAAQQRRPGYVAAWLRMGEIQAEDIKTAPFDAARFKSVVTEARKLVRVSLKQALVKLTDLCARAGVAVVLTREIRNAGVSGAVRWLSKEKALIQLSLKYKTHDQLWFTFFHEAGHILLHGKRQVFIEYGVSDATEEEHEANGFARALLIPLTYQPQLAYLRTREQICAFAESVGITPGIVVGRLQRDGLLRPSAYNDLKTKVDWE